MAMTAVPDALAIAANLHQAGRLQEASQVCQQILAVDPRCPDALQLLGLIAYRIGDADAAKRFSEQAIAVKPDCAAALNILGLALRSRGRWSEAIDSFRRAVEVEPGFADAYFHLGHALLDQQKPREAIGWFQRAVQLKPDWAEAFCRLGDAFYDLKQLTDAIGCYQRALALNSEFAAAHYNLGTALKDFGRFDEARTCFSRALDLNPGLIEALYNLGYVFQQQGKLDEAVEHYRRVLEQRPDWAEAHNSLGLTLYHQRKLDDAAECYRRALELNPDLAGAHCNLSFVMLLRGDFQRGWPEYEWRWKTGRLRARDFRRPRWDGQPLASKSILLHAEQGLGDTIQFIRYASLVKNQGATVVVECHKSLLRLLASCSGIDRLIGHGEALPETDVHAPLLSLPGIFKTSLETIPANVPYLFADPTLVAEWREKLGNVSGFKIGINWHGEKGRREYRNRDVPLSCLTSLADLPGASLVSLQRGGQAELAAAPGSQKIVDLGDGIDKEHGAFMDTVAIMKNLDLVLTSDTSVAHVAGTLGVPVWIVLPFAGDWRWLLDRADSPWYPTMRIFRQKSPGDWNHVFSELRIALTERIQQLPTTR
jgi:tetratricopeptide (TPR) repeat protein